MMFRRALLSLVVLAPRTAAAEGNCTVVDVDFLPAGTASDPFAPQIVAWIEDTTGKYLDTIFITQQTGTFGIGNRPGRFDFNSGPNWPYGRRITVFPVWAHRHGLMWTEITFQNGRESDLSHPVKQSSRELHFCRPLQSTGPDKPNWDAMTCASPVGTDKGVMTTGTNISLYPPRNDVAVAQYDDPSVGMYDALNPFDAVSQATPPIGAPAVLSWPVPETLPFGDYVLFVEVSREFDMNSSYNPTVLPPPAGIPFETYGEPYRGQPSVVYKVPFSILATSTVATTMDYVGYGHPSGLDGSLHPPDGTITIDVPGSGASRLELLSQGSSTYRIRVQSNPQVDFDPPAAPGNLQLASATSTSAAIAFEAPGDDGTTGKVQKYEVRFRVGEPITDDNFETSQQVSKTIVPSPAGAVQFFTLDGLLPETDYSVAVRAIDDCRNAGPLAILSFTTPTRPTGELDACFIATAAYGSVMASDVAMLRRFRDAVLRKTALGELAIETYYTFSPALSNVVGESDLLRATARDLLAPIVERVRAARF